VAALFLVRHGRPLVVQGRPAHEWTLDPAYDDDVRALRPQLPDDAAWFSSPEPKALLTARLLTEQPIEIVPDLREHERRTTDWIAEFEPVVARAFAHPDRSAYAGWEPLADTRRRVVAAASGILATHADQDVVLVGHGTAWTLLRAALSGTAPDLGSWAASRMPDVIECGSVQGWDDMLNG
jgi:broad specificity phosphatase PhoE